MTLLIPHSIISKLAKSFADPKSDWYFTEDRTAHAEGWRAYSEELRCEVELISKWAAASVYVKFWPRADENAEPARFGGHSVISILIGWAIPSRVRLARLILRHAPKRTFVDYRARLAKVEQ